MTTAGAGQGGVEAGGSAKVSCGSIVCACVCVCAESSKLLVRVPLTKDTDCC